MNRKLIVVSTAIAVAMLSSVAVANPYASGITPDGADGASFVLNEDADSVMLVLDGGAGGTYPLPTTTGVHSFSLSDFAVTGAHSFSIEVNKAAPAGWTQISTDDMSTSFYSPRGISVNKNANSPLFGNVYVSNAVPGMTGYGRDTGDGIYTMNAAMHDLSFADGGVDWSGGSGPWKSFVGADDHVYVCNYNDDTLYEFSGDFSSAPQIIGPDQKFDGQYVASVWVEGTQAGGDRVLYTASSNYPTYGVISYDIGGAAMPAGTGDTFISPDAYGFYPYDLVKDSNDDWYTIQYRWANGQAPNATKFDGTGTVPLGDDPLEIMWDTAEQDGGGYCMDIDEDAGYIAIGFSGGESISGVVHFFDLDTGAYLGEFDAGVTYVRDLSFDAAGNLYVGDNSSEWVKVFSPGGEFEFTTDGWFTIPEPASLALLALGGLALIRRR